MKMERDFPQVSWSDAVVAQCRDVITRGYEEDLNGQEDWTTTLLVPAAATGAANVVSRESGVIAGLPAAELALKMHDEGARFTAKVADGSAVQPGDVVATVAGSARSLLTAERLMLNLLGRLSGIATLTSQYVAEVGQNEVGVYDTRKTTPGWRLLEKYAVQCGGGRNHRTGLSEAVLIKDNHLAIGTGDDCRYSPAEAVAQFREKIADPNSAIGEMMIEVEVDTLDQLKQVLSVTPDIVLLDNMSCDQLRQAVAMREELAPGVQLEASGGVNLSTIGGIAETGIERISVGALTHSARCLDVGLDWLNK